MKDLIIYGAGDVGKFVAWNYEIFGERYRLIGMVDDDPRKADGEVCGLPVWGSRWFDERPLDGLCVVVAISSPEAKARIAAALEPRGVLFPTLIARRTWISKEVRIGRGTLVYPNCSVEHETQIGDFVTINAGCTVGHNVRVGDFATVSPGVHLGGFTDIGEGAFLGIGCCTRQGVKIGARSIVGGQAMVTGDIGPGETAVGVPAKIKRQ